MRYIGSKINLLEEIEIFIREHINDDSAIFMDLFSGTATVAEYFKKTYEIHSNDYLFFSYVIQQAKIVNNTIPTFSQLKLRGIEEPLSYLEKTSYEINESYFITHNYSPYNNSERMYLSIENASRIDFIRQEIENWKQNNLITQSEYFYLLAILIESVPFISNISGTYGAFLKHWDKRSLGKLTLKPLNIIDNGRDNRAYNLDSNDLISTLEGDILYIDTPYNSRQYITNYHLLETIAMYDYPEIYGKTGLRPYEDKKSMFCSKRNAYEAFDNLIKQAKYKHIVVSYSTDGILSIDEISKILSCHGIESTLKMKKIPYRKYKSKHNQKVEELFELLFYVEKDIDHSRYSSVPSEKSTAIEKYKNYDNGAITSTSPDLLIKKNDYHLIKNVTVRKYKKSEYVKSPLNYIGGKYKLLNQLIPLFPKQINTFVDLFAGGLNVGINVKSENVIVNDLNTFVIEVLEAFKSTPEDKIIEHIYGRIEEYSLSKENEEGYLSFRKYYNSNKNPLDLYTLICFSFNYQFRFNNNLDYNNPFGRNRSHFSKALETKLRTFINEIQNNNIEIHNKEFQNMDFSKLTPNDLVYCDPPYLITTGSYNDGNRGFINWNLSQEQKLLNMLDELDSKGVKFALSNVLRHKGKENHLLIEWSKKYRVHSLTHNYSNSSHNTARGESEEVLITNY